MKQLGFARVLTGDSAAIIRTSFQAAAEVRARRPDAIYCGCTSNVIDPLLRDLRHNGYFAPIVGPDVLAGSLDAGDQTPKHSAIFSSEPSLDPQHASDSFLRAYRAAYHTEPNLYDAPAYDAAGIALQAIVTTARSGRLQGELATVRRAVALQVGRARYVGAIGVTAFDRNGDTTRPIVSIYRERNGAWDYTTSVLAPTIFSR